MFSAQDSQKIKRPKVNALGLFLSLIGVLLTCSPFAFPCLKDCTVNKPRWFGCGLWSSRCW